MEAGSWLDVASSDKGGGEGLGGAREGAEGGTEGGVGAE